MLTSCKMIIQAGIGMVGWAILGGTVGATAAGPYGVLCGTLATLACGDLWMLVSIGPYLTLCGAGAGAIVGGFARIIDPEGVTDLRSRSR